jgi:hypothetical protein
MGIPANMHCGMRENVALVLLISGFLVPAFGEDVHPTYSQLRPFTLAAAQARAENVVLKRDRVEMHFDGVFYPEKAVEGKVRGAVFIGTGKVKIEPPDVEYERDNLRRMIKAERIEADFKTAVLRFSDDTWAELGLKETGNGGAPEQAVKLARELAPRLLKDAGLNPDARIAVSILNRESPGVFLAQFEEGKLGRFTVAVDPQGRIPGVFGLNAGEQGMVFQRHGPMGGNDIWLAFASLESIAQHLPLTSEQFDVIRLKHYAMKVDLTEVKAARMSVEATIDAEAFQDGVRAIPFTLNEGLGEYKDERLKKALHCEWVKAADGTALEFAQEGWETGLTVLLPTPITRGGKTKFTIRVGGEAILRPGDAEYQHYGPAVTLLEDVFYPRSTVSWYPTHGYLQRATYDLVFLHRDGHRAISIGVPYEVTGGAAKGEKASGWKMDKPVSLATFVVGALNRYVKPAGGGVPEVEYNAPGVFMGKSSENWMLTELSNAVGFYAQLFGPYPFERVNSVIHPRGYGQGFPTLLLVPPTRKSTNKYEFSFYAHEMAHQWWGHVVGWKTYRDQWLSEGFAEYSAALYVKVRMDRDAQAEVIRRMRRQLIMPPATETGIGSGKVAELGPMILGLRAATPQTLNAYYALTYFKGALVLRMLHFLFTHPGTGDDSAFYAMLRDFTARYAGRAASTEDFFAVASEHFRRSPLGIKYHLQNLDWFYRQWVLEAVLPSYRLEYSIQQQPNGVLLNGVVYQKGAPDDWFMPLPLTIRFGKDQEARGSVQVKGAQSSFSIPLPAAPVSVTLDPDLYILSEKTETGH